MHRILACGVGVFVAFASVVSASAADLPRPVYKSPAYLSPVPIHNWTGFYVGVHGGYGWSKFSGDGTFGPGSATAKDSSAAASLATTTRSASS